MKQHEKIISPEQNHSIQKQNSFSARDVLDFLVENGTINTDDVLNQMKRKELEEHIRSVHPYKIWQGVNDKRWRTYIKDDQAKSGKRMIAKSTKKAVFDVLIPIYDEEAKQRENAVMTLRKFYPTFLEYKRIHTDAPTSITRLNSDWKTHYSKNPIIDIPIKDLTKLDLDIWVHKFIQEQKPNKTKYYNVTGIMRQMLDLAVQSDIIPVNVFSLVKVDGKRLFRKDRKKPNYSQVFTNEEVKGITSLAWEDFENKTKVYELSPLALLFMFQTGLRLGEVCVVRYSDIESENFICIHSMYRRQTREVVEYTKGNSEEREVYLSNTAKKLIEAARARQKEYGVETDFIFSINNLPLTERSIADLYRKYCKKLGIMQKSSHKARKTYISSLIDSGMNINTVREMSGHSSEKTTYRNYVFDRSTEKEKIEKFESALSY